MRYNRITLYKLFMVNELILKTIFSKAYFTNKLTFAAIFFLPGKSENFPTLMKFCQNVIQEVSYRFPSSPRGWTFRLPQLEKNWMFPNNFEIITPLRRSSLPFYHRKIILKKKSFEGVDFDFCGFTPSASALCPECPLLYFYIYFFFSYWAISWFSR